MGGQSLRLGSWRPRGDDRSAQAWANLEALPKDPARLNDPTLLVGATDILNGVSVAIRGDGETMTRQKQMAKPAPEPFDYDDVIASLAIPPLYKDVERRGTALWDGLFSVNPPIYALTTLNPKPEEIWVIQINPQRTRSAPKSMRDIVDRRDELGGNVSLNKELDMIETINGMLRNGHLSGDHHYRGITIRMVGIEEDEDARTSPMLPSSTADRSFWSAFRPRPGPGTTVLRGRVIARPVHSAPHPVRASGALRGFECPSEGPVKLVASGLLLD